jgi:acetylglutamate kinase
VSAGGLAGRTPQDAPGASAATGAGPSGGLGRLEDAPAKAAVLVEALPYIRRFWGQTVVIKYGGNALAAAAGAGDSLGDFATDIVLMHSVGMHPVVVHGGGPQIGELMARLGKTSEFRDGLRVTDAETLDIARMVLVGKVNRDIVAAINVHGPLAVGVSGEDAGLITATARDPELGFVGDVAQVNPTILERLVAQELIPVVATIGSDDTGQAYNINADTAAGAVAEALGATKLVFLTDVEGIRTDAADPASLIETMTPDELEELIREGAVRSGMIPKARAALEAVRNGVRHAHILDGRAPHALLLEVFTRSGVGTMVSDGAGEGAW